ncbi:MAG: hypothetical protein KGN33_03650 [Paracoccaceae bacterium]|nr:hypothetical protein [Paracoccaceae bacterium]
MDDLNLFEDERAPARRLEREKGGFFIVNLTCMRILHTSGVTLSDVSSYLCLAVSTDETNMLSKAGKKSLKSLLGLSERGVKNTLLRLSEIGAIVALDDARKRGPGLRRYQLMPVGMTQATIEKGVPVGTDTSTTESPNLLLDPRLNIIVPNAFVRPNGSASSPLQFIHTYGELTTLWTALRCLFTAKPLHLSLKQESAPDDCVQIGPLRLRPYRLPKFADLAVAGTEETHGLPWDVAGLLGLGLAEVRLRFKQGDVQEGAYLPAATMRSDHIDVSAPSGPLSLLHFWLGHPEMRDYRAVEDAPTIIAAWKNSDVQFLAAPKRATDGQVQAILHLDIAAETPLGRQEQDDYVGACRRGVADLLNIIQRLEPDRSALAEALVQSLGADLRILKRKT